MQIGYDRFSLQILNYYPKVLLFSLQVEYLIKYKGYPDSENTWEPSDNLECPKIIANYEKANKNRKVNIFYEYEAILAKRIMQDKVSLICTIYYLQKCNLILTMFSCLGAIFGEMETYSR